MVMSIPTVITSHKHLGRVNGSLWVEGKYGLAWTNKGRKPTAINQGHAHRFCNGKIVTPHLQWTITFVTVLKQVLNKQMNILRPQSIH